MKVPNFTFCRGREHKTTFFFFSWTLIQSFRIQFQKHLPTFDDRELNELELKCDKVWSCANLLFKWRFRSCRRRRCFSSLLWSMRSLLYKEFSLCRYHNVSKVSLKPAWSGDRLAYKLSWKFSQAQSAGSRNEKRRTLRKSSQGTDGTVNQKNNSQASISALFCKEVTIVLRSTPDCVQDVQPWGQSQSKIRRIPTLTL